jgi:hypothetical protein
LPLLEANKDNSNANDDNNKIIQHQNYPAMSNSPKRLQSNWWHFVGLSSFWTILQITASYFATIVKKVCYTIVGTFAMVVVMRML